MRIRKVRQILKSIADDTRLRIVNLLDKQPLNVSELCEIMGAGQSNISKHLSRLRLTGIVSYRKDGFNVYYHLREADEKAHRALIEVVTKGFSELDVFQRDMERLKQTKRKKTKRR